ncbi:hypothetical protein I5N59_25390 [Serratia marcescens]|uniref:hypothetical protein n=1 Tax=Serratia marcescens TaxID=615 RepID=UPI0018D9ED94|nr:hypothetical protein [Serratia marcescens]
MVKSRKSLNIVGAICLATAIGGTSLMASAAETTQAAAAQTETLALLDGKQTFKLQGYEKQPVPGGGPGTMYVNKPEKRVLIIGEEEIPTIARGASDADLLNGMKSIKDKQKQASPSYKVISEKTENINGLPVYHIEATDKMGGNDVQQATLLAVADKKLTVIQVISNHKDKAGHLKAVNNILSK